MLVNFYGVILEEPMSHNNSLIVCVYFGHGVGNLILGAFGICWLSTWKHVDFQVFLPVYKIEDADTVTI